jgi:hypothetical protein
MASAAARNNNHLGEMIFDVRVGGVVQQAEVKLNSKK